MKIGRGRNRETKNSTDCNKLIRRNWRIFCDIVSAMRIFVEKEYGVRLFGHGNQVGDDDCEGSEKVSGLDMQIRQTNREKRGGYVALARCPDCRRLVEGEEIVKRRLKIQF